MKKSILALLAMTLVAGAGLTATADAQDTGYDSDMFAAQGAHDAFNMSVKQRMQIARLPMAGYGGMAMTSLRSDDALGQTPSYRSASSDGAYTRRQIDCNYNNGFTVWGDIYGAWAKQQNNDGNNGYKYQVGGPALGFDWSNGVFTAGVATTLSWGKIQAREIDHSRKTRSWGVIGYGQWSSQNMYANATIGYGYNRFRSNQRGYNTSGSYHSNSWDFAGEFGYKLKFMNALSVTPNIGLRYFNDKRNSFSESGPSALNVSGRSYNTLELPIGVDVGYEIITSGAILVPHVNFTWAPELDRKRGNATGIWKGNNAPVSEVSPRHGRNGFLVGGGLQAKFSSNITAHLEYNLEFRHKKYAHHLNLGVGFTF